MNSPRKILIVDDEAGLVKLCTLIFREAGYQVRGAVNGRQALRMIHEEMPDVALLDVMMPGMTGIELCSQIQARYPASAPSILMYSADDRLETKEKSLSAGALDFIAKSVPPFELPQRIDRYLSD